MKKLIALTLLLSLLCACGTTSKYPTDNEYHPETDYPYAMSMILNWREFVETDSGYYFWVPFSMFYMDKDTMKPIPLCSKPNCLHFEETEREKYRLCHAYIHGVGAGLPVAWHNNNLYVVAKNQEAVGAPNIQILEISPDGSRRKTLWTFDTDMSIQVMRCHRGKMYLAAIAISESGNRVGSIWSYDLTNPGNAPERLLEYPLFNNTVTQNFTIHGHYLYFARFSSDSTREFCIYNLDTGDLLTFPPDDTNMFPYTVLFLDDSMLMLYQKGIENQSNYVQQLYKCDFDGSNQEFITDDHGLYTADGQYIYRGTNFWVYENTDHYLHIYDADYNEIDRVDLYELPGMGKPVSVSYHISSDQVIIEAWESGTNRKFHYWFNKSEIGSGAIQPQLFIDYDQEYTEQGKI